MKTILYLILLVSVAYFVQAQDYIIQNDGTASATLPKPVTMKTVTTGVTAPKTLRITFEYQYSADKTGTNTQKDLIVCCVTAASSSSDNLAKFATDRCFSSQVVHSDAGAADAATKVKHIFAAGTKSTTNFVPHTFIGTADGTGAAFAARTAAFLYTTPAYDLDNGQLATIGLLTSVPGTLTYTCNRGAESGTNGLTAGTAIAIPGGTATTFTVTGTGTACSSTSTTKSNAFVQSIASFAMLSAVLALILA